MRILIISPNFPYPPDTGGKLRGASVAMYLAKHNEVIFACFGGEKPERENEFSKHFIELRTVPLKVFKSQLRAWISPLPGWVRHHNSAAMYRCANDLVKRYCPEVLLVGDPALSQYVLPYSDRVRILDYICVDTLQFKRLRGLSSGSENLLWAFREIKYRLYLKKIVSVYDLCIVNSDEDRDALLSVSKSWKRIEFIPNGLDLSLYPFKLADPRPNTIIFPGAITYDPNFDAVSYFIHEIFPAIRDLNPNTKFLITGKIPSDRVAPDGPGVSYTGYVPDVRQEIAKSWVCVVPLRAGAGGARFKVLETLALGTPMVSTSIGVEGMDVTDGKHFLLADDPKLFSKKVLDILQSPRLREELSNAGRNLIETRYNWEKIGVRFQDLIKNIYDKKRMKNGY